MSWASGQTTTELCNCVRSCMSNGVLPLAMKPVMVGGANGEDIDLQLSHTSLYNINSK